MGPRAIEVTNRKQLIVTLEEQLRQSKRSENSKGDRQGCFCTIASICGACCYLPFLRRFCLFGLSEKRARDSPR